MSSVDFGFTAKPCVNAAMRPRNSTFQAPARKEAFAFCSLRLAWRAGARNSQNERLFVRTVEDYADFFEGYQAAANQSSPSSPHCRKRCFQRMMVGAVVCNCRLIALKDEPSASRRINLARNTYPAGRARDWAMLLRSDCCCLVSKTSLPVAMTTWMLST